MNKHFFLPQYFFHSPFLLPAGAQRLSGVCGTRTVPENFHTEKYNVHRYELAAPGGVAVELALEITEGS